MTRTNSLRSDAQSTRSFSCVITWGNLAAKRKPAGVRSRQPSTIRSVGMR
jgi:hypothetical protein